jgi:hypothetical protein
MPSLSANRENQTFLNILTVHPAFSSSFSATPGMFGEQGALNSPLISLERQYLTGSLWVMQFIG